MFIYDNTLPIYSTYGIDKNTERYDLVNYFKTSHAWCELTFNVIVQGQEYNNAVKLNGSILDINLNYTQLAAPYNMTVTVNAFMSYDNVNVPC